MNYAGYLKMVIRGNELTNGSYKVFTEAEWIKNQEIEDEANLYY